MEILLCITAAVVLFINAMLIYRAFSRSQNKKWFQKPHEEGNFLDCNGAKIFYRSRGKNEPCVIVLNEPGSSSAEWWPVQNNAALYFRVICFDRPGYGRSQVSGYSGGASSVSEYMNLLIKFGRIKKPVILVASGTASIYARYFAARHPENVAGLFLINPVLSDYGKWIKSLSEFEEYIYPEALARKRMKKAINGIYRIFSPLAGYKLDKRYKRAIVEHYSSSSTYQTQLLELASMHNNHDETTKLKTQNNIPIRYIYSGNESLIREWIKNGVPEYTARQVCRLYKELARTDNNTEKSKTFEIEGRGEYIHLGDPKVISEMIIEFVKEIHK